LDEGSHYCKASSSQDKAEYTLVPVRDSNPGSLYPTAKIMCGMTFSGPFLGWGTFHH